MSDITIKQLVRQNLTGLILAGGLATRMGQIDKGLQLFRGETLVAKQLQRLQMQVNAVLINANRNLPLYHRYGVPVVGDLRNDFAGPLAGLEAGLAHCQTPWLISVPCDSPFFPEDLAERLLKAATSQATLVAVAATRPPEESGQWHMEPVFALLHVSLLSSLSDYLNSKQRKLGYWLRQHQPALVHFDDSSAFLNFNTLQELRQYDYP